MVPVFGGDGQHAIQRGQQGLTRAKGIQRPGADEGLQGALGHFAQIHPLDEVLDIGEGAAFAPGG